MPASRRAFLDTLATSTLTGAMLLGAAPAALAAAAPADAGRDAPGHAGPFGPTGFPDAAQGEWNTTWNQRLTGRLRAVFDVPEVESGIPVWRASIWKSQYETVLRIPSAELSVALVLRHNAIVLAMQQSHWDRYGLGEKFSVRNPLSGEPTNRNVALLGAADGAPEPYSQWTLDRYVERGGIALACDLALRALVVPHVQAVDRSSPEEAYTRARAGLQPGVILQPSGMFAVIRAQEAGAFYFSAS